MKRIVVLLSCIFALNLNAMEVKSYSWLDTLEKVVFGDAPIAQLFSFKSNEPEAFELTSFSDVSQKNMPFSALPKDIQNTIIGYLSAVIGSTDPVASAGAISSLAKVNKELNKKINNFEFTQKLIENFYEKFAGTIYIMPYRFEYEHLIISKGSKMDIPKNNPIIGYMSVAILLKTQGAIKWLKGCIPFKQWVAKANQEYEQYWEDVRVLSPWT